MPPSLSLSPASIQYSNTLMAPPSISLAHANLKKSLKTPPSISLKKATLKKSIFRFPSFKFNIPKKIEKLSTPRIKRIRR